MRFCRSFSDTNKDSFSRLFFLKKEKVGSVLKKQKHLGKETQLEQRYSWNSKEKSSSEKYFNNQAKMPPTQVATDTNPQKERSHSVGHQSFPNDRFRCKWN